MGYSISEADESIRRQILAERAKNKMDAGDYKGAYELICSSISDIEYSDEVIHATLARLQNKQFRYHHDCSSFIILNEWLESQGVSLVLPELFDNKGIFLTNQELPERKIVVQVPNGMDANDLMRKFEEFACKQEYYVCGEKKPKQYYLCRFTQGWNSFCI